MAAMGVMRPTWLPPHMSKRFDSVLQWYEKHKWLILDQACYSTWSNLSGVNQANWYVVDNLAPLVPDSDPQNLQPIPKARLKVYAYTDVPSKILWGHTAVGVRGAGGPTALRVHLVSPYKHLYVLENGSQIRVGPSSGKTEADSLMRLSAASDTAIQMGLIPSSYVSMKPVGGVRAFTAQGPHVSFNEDHSEATISGMGKGGYWAAPILADEILKGMP